jgi:urea transporter
MLTTQWLNAAASCCAYTAPFVVLGWVLLLLEPTAHSFVEAALNAMLRGSGRSSCSTAAGRVLIVIGLCLPTVCGHLGGDRFGHRWRRRAAGWRGAGAWLGLVASTRAGALPSVPGPAAGLPLLAIALALLLHAAVRRAAVATLTAPFILAGWLMPWVASGAAQPAPPRAALAQGESPRLR